MKNMNSFKKLFGSNSMPIKDFQKNTAVMVNISSVVQHLTKTKQND